MVVLLDLHALQDAPAANDVERAPAAEQLPSVWRAKRVDASLAIGAALRARGTTGGRCALRWHEPAQRANERLRGERVLGAEHLAALSPADLRAALEALLALRTAS